MAALPWPSVAGLLGVTFRGRGLKGGAVQIFQNGSRSDLSFDVWHKSTHFLRAGTSGKIAEDLYIGRIQMMEEMIPLKAQIANLTSSAGQRVTWQRQHPARWFEGRRTVKSTYSSGTELYVHPSTGLHKCLIITGRLLHYTSSLEHEADWL